MNYKEAIYHFRKFAIKNGFIHEYGRLSNWGLFYTHGVKNIPSFLKSVEPVKYIQNVGFFCSWPSSSELKWRELSKKWAKYCLKNKVYYDYENAKSYIECHIR